MPKIVSDALKMYTADGEFFITDYIRGNLAELARSKPGWLFGGRPKIEKCEPIHYTNIAHGKLWTDKSSIELENQRCALELHEYERKSQATVEKRKVSKSKEDKTNMGIPNKETIESKQPERGSDDPSYGKSPEQPQPETGKDDSGHRGVPHPRGLPARLKPELTPEVKHPARTRMASVAKVKTILMDGQTGYARCIMSNGELQERFAPFCGINGVNKDTRVVIENVNIVRGGTTVEINISDSLKEGEFVIRRRK